MADYSKSFNYILGIYKNLEDFDFFDNPYVEPRVYELDERWVPRLATNVKLRHCLDQDLMFLSEDIRHYYPNSICFEKKSALSFDGSWFNGKFKNFYISLDACQNTEKEPNKCKPLDEIYEFVQNTVFYSLT